MAGEAADRRYPCAGTAVFNQPILAHIIVNREITEPDAVARYLSDDLAYAHDPALMKDMVKGCQIMKEKIRAGKKIRIISDYDVDASHRIIF